MKPILDIKKIKEQTKKLEQKNKLGKLRNHNHRKLEISIRKKIEKEEKGA